ncbi:MAG: hypothetical protein ACRD20_15005 [Terriglobales bacterium]
MRRFLYSERTDCPEVVTAVHDGDAVLISSECFGSRTPHLFSLGEGGPARKRSRQFGVVNLRRGFDLGSSGLKARRKQ